MKKDDTDLPKQDTEHAILMAAEHEFLSKGFAGARTTSIAEAAGVTHAMLHYYFRTKAKLFECIIKEKTALLKKALLAPMEDGNGSLEDIVSNIVERHLDFLCANPYLPRFLIEEMYSGSENSKTFISQIKKHAPVLLGRLQNKIDEAVAKGECRGVSATTLMLDIVSLNVFSFVAVPIIEAALGEEFTINSDTFLALRKKENVDTIMRKLKP